VLKLYIALVVNCNYRSPVNSRACSKTLIPVLLGVLTAIFMTSAVAQYCKWVDKTGCVHYAEKCPPDVEAAGVDIQEEPCTDLIEAEPPKISTTESPDEAPDEVLQKALEQSSFEPIESASQLRGCWERILPPADINPNPNKIEIYPFEEPRYQFFCFESARKLYTLLTTRKLDESPRKQKKTITRLRSVERYSIPRSGAVEIEHLDSGGKLYWVTSVAKVVGVEELHGMRTGDLLMTIRSAKTGEDLYYRHLRKID